MRLAAVQHPAAPFPPPATFDTVRAPLAGSVPAHRGSYHLRRTAAVVSQWRCDCKRPPCDTLPSATLHPQSAGPIPTIKASATVPARYVTRCTLLRVRGPVLGHIACTLGPPRVPLLLTVSIRSERVHTTMVGVVRTTPVRSGDGDLPALWVRYCLRTLPSHAPPPSPQSCAVPCCQTVSTQVRSCSGNSAVFSHLLAPA